MRYMRNQLKLIQHIPTPEVAPTDECDTGIGMRRDGSRKLETEEEGTSLASISYDYN